MTPAALSDVLAAIVRDLVDAGELTVAVPATVPVARPRSADLGDYATPVALQLARSAGVPAREIAEAVAGRLRKEPAIADAEVAGPGFVNIRLAGAALGETARTVVEAGADYGRAPRPAEPTRVNVEFVSANPTGPVTLASARWAAVGDALARVLDAAGYAVGREYYVNDAGVQVERLAASVLAALRGRPIPEDGYQGAYIGEIAKRIAAENPDIAAAPDGGALAALSTEATARMLTEIRQTLAGFGVEYDAWKSERELHTSGALDAAVADLRAHGHVFDADGAVWLRTTDFGDDKDRALVKSDGRPTYFCADAAYYRDKRGRGFDRLVYLLGADHHGYVGRLKAIAACFGDDPAATLEVIIGQLVTLTRDGVPVKMSKRAGVFLTLTDLTDAVGVDAARYHLVRSSLDSALNLDLELIARRTNDNPVFYVQYAHARICSLRRSAADLAAASGLAPDGDPAAWAASSRGAADLGLLTEPREAELLGALAEFPGVVGTAAELRAPHRVARYLEELASTYHRFYDSHRVLPRDGEAWTPLVHARLLLAEAAGVVLANGLRLLGVSAPERM
jgi:arginyl-tRNA synthetase